MTQARASAGALAGLVSTVGTPIIVGLAEGTGRDWSNPADAEYLTGEIRTIDGEIYRTVGREIDVASGKDLTGADLGRAERDVRRMEGIICSMTPLERRKPELIKASRKRRIAAGAGVQVQDVNRMLNQFEQMQGMMKKMKGGGLMKMMKRMGGMKGMPKLPGM